VVDQHSKTVIDVLEDRKMQTLQNWFEVMEPEEKGHIETIAMDMWDPFIGAVRNTIPDWESKVCFDRFHVSSHYGKALDKVRASEHRQFLKTNGESPLAKTKHDWLRNSGRTDNRSRRWFVELTRKNLKTARAWAIKETAANLWDYVTRGHAQNAWMKLIILSVILNCA
jgi:transposase